MTPRVGDVVRIGKGKALWTVERHHERAFPEVVVHLWDLVSQTSARRWHLDLRSDVPGPVLVWTLEEIVYGAEAVGATT